MKFVKFITALTLSLSLGAGAVQAQDAVSNAIKARQAQMVLYAFNLGQLGAMAKGIVEYNADAASAAASNLVKLTSMNDQPMWIADSDEMSAVNTRAKAEIWENFPDVDSKSTALTEASLAMQAAAGNGLDALREAMGGVGRTCGACHKLYRVRKD